MSTGTSTLNFASLAAFEEGRANPTRVASGQRRQVEDLLDAHEVLVVQVPQNPELTERPLREGEVLERRLDLLDRQFLAARLGLGRADDPVPARRSTAR